MKKRYYSDKDIKGQVLEVLRQLQQDKWMPDYIVGLTRGGLVPATMMSHYLDVPMETLQVSLRDRDDEGESNLWMSEDAFGYKQDKKNILIVDDINDTGATLQWIKENWKSNCFPDDEIWNEVWGNNVRFATLVNNEASDFKEINYTSTYINKANDPIWIVFPWEDWWNDKGALC